VEPAAVVSTVTVDLAPDLAPDPLLPARDVLLDPGSVGELLSDDGGAVATDAVLVRTKYRIGESLRVLYRVTVEGSEHLVAGRMSPPGRRVSAGAVVPTATGAGLPPVFVSGALDTVWWTFPHDRRLRSVGDLLGPVPGLAAACGLADRWTSTEVVQWTPERSLTVRALGPVGETVAYAKSYAPGTVDVAGLAARYDLAADQLAGDRVLGCLRAPRALAALPARDLLLLEAVPGRPWLGLAPDEASRAFALLGRSIAVLHELPVAAAAATGLGRFGRFGMPRLLRGAELVATARPDLAVAARRLATHLEATAPSEQQEVVLHGDCHPGNLLVGEQGVSLIDLDQSGLGPAAADLGSLLARLQHGMLAGERTAAVTRTLGEAFVAGYAEVRRPPSPAGLAWYTAAALLGEQAVRSVNRVRRPALARLAHLLGVAETIRTEGVLS
jgi:aminoglycoside phosphotransferase